jgi:glycosyltransferase involved in cell wall biosynthesis
MNIIIAITTYNRLNRLSHLINSFALTKGKKYNHTIVIADDGSTDGTLEYVQNLNIGIPVTLIKNNRQGVHHQFNTIVNEMEKIDFDYCFKCDDDIEFIKTGWEQLYIDAIIKSGYDHLCHFDRTWRPEKNFKKPVYQNNLISHCQPKDIQGAFFTLTPEVINKVGYMDTQNFSFRGVGHVDYSIRACRAGFNDIRNPFDAKESNQFIKHQRNNYSSALNKHVQNAIDNDETTKRKYTLIEDSSRLYIPLLKEPPSLDLNLEKELMLKRLDTLENEKAWYEETYSHQPKWFVRLGKVLNLISSIFLNRKNE